MNPKRRVPSAMRVLFTLVALVASHAARAQSYDDARRGLELGADAATNSPRLLGMGRLTLVVDDVHHRFDVWETTGNPAGLIESDTSSVVEMTPARSSRTAVHDEQDGRESQDQALREFTTAYELWRRSHDGTAFGLKGDYSRLQTDFPNTRTTEKRSQFSTPRTTFVLSGKSPLFSKRLRYGLTFAHRYETRNDATRGVVTNAAGDYIDKDGVTLTNDNTMQPIEYSLKTLGARVGLLYKVAPKIDLAVGYDYAQDDFEGFNDQDRSTTEIRETRPYSTFSASAAGSEGPFRFVADARSWKTPRTDETWFATFSTGSGAVPLLGRGLYQRRDETGHQYGGRASYAIGEMTLSAGGTAWQREISTYVPPVDDRTSFNHFLNLLSGRPGADSLYLPDSLVDNASTEKRNEYGAGAAYRLPWRKALAGAEYHVEKSTFEQTVSGSGPDQKAWDVRTGLEVPMSSDVVLRGGYVYRWIDYDENLSQDEFTSNSATFGLTYRPPHGSWTFDFGYLARWGKADFGDPTRIRSNDQSGSFRIRWVF